MSLTYSPRRSWHRDNWMHGPTDILGRHIRSWMLHVRLFHHARSGHAPRHPCSGFSISTFPRRWSAKTWYSTLGIVVTRSSPNSRSSLSCTISMCRRPRKPHRKAESKCAWRSPARQCKAGVVQRAAWTMASRNTSNSIRLCAGYRPAKTIDLASRYPGSISGSSSVARSSASRTVSPTRALADPFLMPGAREVSDFARTELACGLQD